MDPNAPMTVEHFRQAIWALAIGSALGFGLVFVVGWWLDRRWHQRWQREKQEREREQAERQHEWERLQQIRDQLWLKSLPEEARERVLESRRHTEERERLAQELLHREREGTTPGRDDGRGDRTSDA